MTTDLLDPEDECADCSARDYARPSLYFRCPTCGRSTLDAIHVARMRRALGHRDDDE